MTMPQTISTLFFWPAAGAGVTPPYLSQGWTLSLEMIFYAAVSLVLVGGRIRRNLMIVTVLAATFVGIRWATGAEAFRVLGNRTFIEFGYGVVLAMMLPWLRRAPVLLTAPLLGIAGLFVGAANLAASIGVDAWQPTLADNLSLSRVFLFGTPAVCIVAAALILERGFKGPIARLLAWLGEASYSLYLVHLLVLVGLWSLWRAVGAPLPFIVVIVGMLASILASVAVHRLVERPLLVRLRRFTSGVHATIAGPAVRPMTAQRPVDL
jgi:exopolysaccharide production protein ExoZ